MKRLAGLDLNGLWDRAAVFEPEDDAPILIKDAGINGSVIRLRCEDRLVAGIQAGMAPHGRGPGWGALGDGKLRRQVADILAAAIEPAGAGRAGMDDREALVALVDDLARDAAHAVFAVSDVPQVDEAARDALLRVLLGCAVPQVTLLWRPIAAMLGWLADGGEAGLKDDASVVVISLLRDAVEIGDARLIAHDGRDGPIPVPERSRGGVRLGPETGAHAMAARAAEAAAAALELSSADVLAFAATPWRLSVGEPAGAELVRLPNRSWRRMPETAVRPPALIGVGEHAAAAQRLAGADIVLVEGPAVGNRDWRLVVLGALGLAPDDPRVSTGDVGRVARGCLEAALRLDRGDPPYFDFLPQLEINAMVRDEPDFVPLIPADTRVQGGERYVGHAPANFEIGRGANALTFFLIKEDFARPRKAERELPETAGRAYPIAVTVEQWPGQGYAKVRIESDSYAPFRSRPLELDWSRMEVVEGDRDSILADLRANAGTAYPDRYIIPGHAIHWHPQIRFGDLAAQLQAYLDRDLFRGRGFDPDGLAALETVRRRAAWSPSVSHEAAHLDLPFDLKENRRFLNGDGSLPEPLPDLAVPPAGADILLDRALAKAANEFEALAERFGGEADSTVAGHLVGFATWCGWRCPNRLVRRLLEIYEDGSRTRCRLPDVNATLLAGGLGRAVHGEAEIRQFLRLVDGRLREEGWLREYEYAALGRVLGGCEDAADLLDPPVAGRLLQEACRLLDIENKAPNDRAYKRKFKYALLMLAVLLRHRRRNPHFLEPEGSRAFKELSNLLGLANKRMPKLAEQYSKQARRTRRPEQSQKFLQFARRLTRLEKIKNELEYFLVGKGRDPNIIRKLEEVD